MHQEEIREEKTVKVYTINYKKENDAQKMADGLQLYNHTGTQNNLSEDRVEVVKLIFNILILLAFFFSFIALLIIKFFS
ncbi:hypothetical protein [Flavobacterium sp. UGB4466]|uniref:hypothetical protein n=1 Tax=Flavobacterium sp. UGB4466 TaxID=2730889 RepID=UPI00192C13B5|nr:hypothetical protein [Flavobacterium sp. UGB4466]